MASGCVSLDADLVCQDNCEVVTKQYVTLHSQYVTLHSQYVTFTNMVENTVGTTIGGTTYYNYSWNKHESTDCKHWNATCHMLDRGQDWGDMDMIAIKDECADRYSAGMQIGRAVRDNREELNYMCSSGG